MMRTEAEVRAAAENFRFMMKQLQQQFGGDAGIESALAAMALEWVLGSDDPAVIGLIEDAGKAAAKIRAMDTNKEKHRLQ